MELTNENLLDHLVDFACNLKFEDLPQKVVDEAKRHMIDSVGCMIGGTAESAAKKIRKIMADRISITINPLRGNIVGLQGSYSLDNAAYANTHAIRALDWNDTYLSKEPAHPSDNLGAILSLAGLKNLTGKDLILAQVLAYEIQCRFCDAASLRAHGWDHTNYILLSTTLAVGKLLGFSREQMKHALALALRSAFSRQVRIGHLSEAKGLAAAEASRSATWAVELAFEGTKGPAEILEGQFGFITQVSGKLDTKAFEGIGEEYKICKTYIKLYPVEYHAQTAVEIALRLRKFTENCKTDILNVKKISIRSSEPTRTIIGDRTKRFPESKESADHSIYYIMATTLLDGKMTLEQYKPEKLNNRAIKMLIEKMSDVEESAWYTEAYYEKDCPKFSVSCIAEFPAGYTIHVSSSLPKGHFANPLNDDELVEKFHAVCGGALPDETSKKLLEALWNLDKIPASSLMQALKQIEIWASK